MLNNHLNFKPIKLAQMKTFYYLTFIVVTGEVSLTECHN